MSTPYIGQIISVGFNFPPVGWLNCDGSLYDISQYNALFSLIGTTYGGNGQTNFAVPDLRGRVPLGMGQGVGQPTYVLGQIAGTETVSLQGNQVGSHTHTLLASSKNGTVSTPGPQNALAINTATQVSAYAPNPVNTTMAGSSIGISPGGLPHENRQPYQTLNFIIAYDGIYPTQG